MSRLLCLTELLRHRQRRKGTRSSAPGVGRRRAVGVARPAAWPVLTIGVPARQDRDVSILGTRVIRTEDPRFLTTGGVYTDDMQLPGACHVHFVRSAVAHARILSVDVSAALEAPGVIAAFTGADLADLPVVAPPMPGMISAQMGQRLLAGDVVRYVGEPLAVVVTEGRYQGEDAADLVDVDFDVLPPVVDMAEAAASQTVLFP